MGETKLKNKDSAACMEMEAPVRWDARLLDDLVKTFRTAHKKSGKVVAALPSCFEVTHPDQYAVFLKTVADLGDTVVFSPRYQKNQWSAHWVELWESQAVATEQTKAKEWSKGRAFKPKISHFLIAKTLYVKCGGRIHQDLKLWHNSLTTALDQSEFPGELRPQSAAFDSLPGVTTWSPLQKGLIIDLADVFCLNREVLGCLSEVLAKHNIKPEDEGVYFVTYGPLQNWALHHAFAGKTIREALNVVRLVTPDTTPAQRESEARALAQICQGESLPMACLVHYLEQTNWAETVGRQLFPSLILADNKDLSAVAEKGLPALKKRIAHVLTAADPKVKILSNVTITPGYNPELFARYMLSRYRHYSGQPNDTIIYHLQTDPPTMHKVASLLQADLGDSLAEPQRRLLSQLPNCPTEPSQQGHFVCCSLQNKVVNLEISLPFTIPGAVYFLSHYADFFSDHVLSILDPLRLFLKSNYSTNILRANISPIQGFVEFRLEEPGLQLEVSLQAQEALLTLQTNNDKQIHKRSLNLIALLGSSELFEKLPNPDLLQEILLFVQENVASEKGFLIALTTSPQKTEIKIFQDSNNKIALRQNREADGKLFWQLTGDTLPYAQRQKALLKLVSLLFAGMAPDQCQGWNFACFETVSQISTQTLSGEYLSFDLGTDNEHSTAVFLNSTPKPCNLAPRSRQIMEKGADKVTLSPNTCRITLMKNPLLIEEPLMPQLEQFATFEQLMNQSDAEFGKLDKLAERSAQTIRKAHEDLDAKSILKNVAKARTQQVSLQRDLLQQVYQQALSAYEEKEPEEEKGDRPPTLAEIGVKTKFRAAKYLKDMKYGKIYLKVGIGLGVAALMAGVAFIYLFYAKIAPPPDPLDPIPIQAQNHTVVGPPAQTTQNTGSTKTATPTPDKSNLTQEMTQLLAGISREMYQYAKKPSHDAFNAVLRRLHTEGRDYWDTPVGADIHNLIGRFYLYKLVLDAEEDLFDLEWKNTWREEAIGAFENAASLYQAKDTVSVLTLPIFPWMPEKQSHGKAMFIKYTDLKQAIQDMENMKERAKSMSFATKETKEPK